jgi:hypothetical protein
MGDCKNGSNKNVSIQKWLKQKCSHTKMAQIKMFPYKNGSKIYMKIIVEN